LGYDGKEDWMMSHIRKSTKEDTIMVRKVFGIGFHKNATSSLSAALRQLGYRVTGPNEVRNPNIAQEVYEMAYTLVEQYDAFQDNPWAIIYKELDKKYPESKFILTLRSTDEWIQSLVRHFGNEHTSMREWIYGVGNPKGHEEIYISRYEQHNQEVLEYFKDRPDDLLVLRITEGEGWEKLCPFLDKDIPNIKFPHVNIAADRERRKERERRLWWRVYYRLRNEIITRVQNV
jgi:signal recognition particle subunit SEC65